jgi:hypothetical protein
VNTKHTEKLALNELQKLAARRMAEVQMARLALERAQDAAEQADALARIMWPDAPRGRRKALRAIQEALAALNSTN